LLSFVNNNLLDSLICEYRVYLVNNYKNKYIAIYDLILRQIFFKF